MGSEKTIYERKQISDSSKRLSEAQAIRQKNKGIDKRSTPIGKKDLSLAWINRAGLSLKQERSIFEELGIKNIDYCLAEELEKKIKDWQKSHGFNQKDCDGILGWKTLEKIDLEIENQHKLEEEDVGNSSVIDKYGLARVEEDDSEVMEKFPSLSDIFKKNITNKKGKLMMPFEIASIRVLKLEQTALNQDEKKYVNEVPSGCHLVLNSLESAEGLTLDDHSRIELNGLKSSTGLVLKNFVGNLSLDGLRNATGLVINYDNDRMPFMGDLFLDGLNTTDGLKIDSHIDRLSLDTIKDASGLKVSASYLFLRNAHKASGMEIRNTHHLEAMNLTESLIIGKGTPYSNIRTVNVIDQAMPYKIDPSKTYEYVHGKVKEIKTINN